MKLNVITGLPRSGSTLFCNILNQNPKFHATSTSELPRFLSSITHQWTNSIDVKNELNIDREGTEARMMKAMKGYVEGWYDTDKVVFDKSRGWSNNIMMLQKLYPKAKTIVMVRDLRNVLASIEKQHKKFPLLDEAGDMQSKTLYTRADKMCSPDGIVGSCIIGIEDIIRRKHKNVMFVKYEEMTAHPKSFFEELYQFLEEEHYDHDFNDVKNTATDPDGFYLHKYPHKGEGKVVKGNPDEWKEHIDESLANTIMAKFADYNKVFNYKHG